MPSSSTTPSRAVVGWNIVGYLLYLASLVVGFLMSLVRPSSRASFSFLIERIDRGLSGVVRGQIIICLVNGVLSAWEKRLHRRYGQR